MNARRRILFGRAVYAQAREDARPPTLTFLGLRVMERVTVKGERPV